MATVTVDIAAVKAALTGTETNRMIARGTHQDDLFNCVNTAVKDLNKALQNIYDLCDATNQTATLTIQQKLLP